MWANVEEYIRSFDDGVEAAQQRIVDVVRRLEDAGELIITGRGGSSEVVV